METWTPKILAAVLGISVLFLLAFLLRALLRKRAGRSGPVIDPVCGMPVVPGKGYVKRYRGRELHFCSEICLAKFEANPGQFVDAPDES